MRERLARAARDAGRTPEEVQLLCVTKSVAPEVALALAEVCAEPGGSVELAENRADGLERKALAFERAGRDVRWHFIGHLQRNKARRVARFAAVVHSVDRPDLVPFLGRVAREEHRHLDVYLQVDFTGEATKHGMHEAEIEEALSMVAAEDHLHLVGLMAMGPLEERTGHSAAEVFARTAALARRLERSHPALFRDGTCRLSMGMSDDLDAAIAAGSTCVRVGSALFRGVEARA